jgi:hypothetical protein
VDANGNTIGLLLTNYGYNYTVVRQISGILMVLPISDLLSGFAIGNGVIYYYQSADCTGQQYLPLENTVSGGSDILPVASIATIPPATQPSIYFSGPPSRLTIQSYRSTYDNQCITRGGFSQWVGLPQSVPLSDLGFTPPFSLK